MALTTADSSEDEGEGLNQEIPQLDRATYDTLLTAVQKAGFNIGTFLQVLFAPPQQGSGNSQKHAQMVSAFLKGEQEVKARDIAELIFSSKYSAPTPVWNTSSRAASTVVRPDPKPMARWSLQQWAIEKVEQVVDKEADAVSSKSGGFHLEDKNASWDFVQNFSMSKVLSVFESKGPTLLRLLITAAMPKDKCYEPKQFMAGAHVSDMRSTLCRSQSRLTK